MNIDIDILETQPTSISASASPAVVTPRRSTPSAKPSPNPSSPTTRNSSTSTPRTSSSRPLSSTTAPSSSPTTGGASPRSSAVPAPAQGTRSRTVKAHASVLLGGGGCGCGGLFCAEEQDDQACSGVYHGIGLFIRLVGVDIFRVSNIMLRCGIVPAT